MNPANYVIPMIELYCKWLNEWTATDPGENPHRYELHQFTVTDPERSLYGNCHVQGIIPSMGCSAARPRFLVSIAITDGDEGGPTELTAWWEVNTDNTTAIVAMVQGFDTNLQFIYEDRTFKNLP